MTMALKSRCSATHTLRASVSFTRYPLSKFVSACLRLGQAFHGGVEASQRVVTAGAILHQGTPGGLGGDVERIDHLQGHGIHSRLIEVFKVDPEFPGHQVHIGGEIGGGSEIACSSEILVAE